MVNNLSFRNNSASSNTLLKGHKKSIYNDEAKRSYLVAAVLSMNAWINNVGRSLSG